MFTGIKFIKQNTFEDGIGVDAAASSNAFLEALGELPEETEVVEEPTEEVEEIIEETEEAVEEEVEEVTEESEEEEPEEATEDEPEDETFLVTIDGKEEEIKADELLASYERQKDYTRKTQALAEERTKVEQFSKELSTERIKYVEALKGIVEAEEATLSEYDKVDWEALRKEDTNQFLLLQYEMKEKRDALEAKKVARDNAIKQAQDETNIKESQYLEAEAARVADMVEGWNGAEHQTLIDGLNKQAEIEGFTTADQELFKHSMVIKLLNKARLYDEGKVKSDTVVKKKIVRKVPKVTKTNKRSEDADTKKVIKQKERLKQTGNIKDSVALFEQFI